MTIDRGEADGAGRRGGRRRLALWLVGGAVASIAIDWSGALNGLAPPADDLGAAKVTATDATPPPTTPGAATAERSRPAGPGGPLLTLGDWFDLTGQEVIVDQAPRSVSHPASPIPVDLSVCGVDVTLLAPTRVDASRYLMPFYGSTEAGHMNEYVLRFGDDAAAAAALEAVRRQYAACPALSASESLGFPGNPQGQGIGAWIDDVFAAEESRAHRERGPVYYSLLAAQEATVVVVVESINGWADRGMRTLNFALMRAGVTHPGLGAS